MDTEAALTILEEQIKVYRRKTYEELSELIGKVDAYDVEMSDGLIYQIEIQVLWDDRPDQSIRVIGAIDDRGRRAYSPLTDSFIMTPEGQFIGE